MSGNPLNERSPHILIALTFKYHYVGAQGIVVTFVEDGIYVSGILADYQFDNQQAANDQA